MTDMLKKQFGLTIDPYGEIITQKQGMHNIFSMANLQNRERKLT